MITSKIEDLTVSAPAAPQTISGEAVPQAYLTTTIPQTYSVSAALESGKQDNNGKQIWDKGVSMDCLMHKLEPRDGR